MPPLVDSKHYNSFPFTPIGVDLLAISEGKKKEKFLWTERVVSSIGFVRRVIIKFGHTDFHILVN